MPRPDEGLIHAWLDGELSPEESERVARLVAEDAEWGEAAADARGLIAASSRILSALDSVPSGVIPKGSRAAPVVTPAKARFAVRPWMRIAAGLVIFVGTAVVLTRDGTSTFMPREEMVAAEDASVAAQGAASEAAPATTLARGDSSPIERREQPQRDDRRQVAGQGADAPAAVSPSVAPTAAQTAAPTAPVNARGEVANAAATQRFSDVAVTGLSTAQKSAPAPAPAISTQGATLGAAGAAAPPPAVVAELADQPARERERAAQDRAAIDRAAQDRAATERTNVARAELDRAATPRAAELRSRAPSAVRSDAGVAAKALSVRALEGCWRTTTAAGADTVLVTPTILRTVGDSLVIAAGSEVRPATIVQDGDALRGETTNAAGVRVPFRATRATCPPGADDDAQPRER